MEKIKEIENNIIHLEKNVIICLSKMAKNIHGKNAVIHETKDGKNVVRLENAKHDNIIFYRGESLQRAQRMYKDLCLTIEKNIL